MRKLYPYLAFLERNNGHSTLLQSAHCSFGVALEWQVFIFVSRSCERYIVLWLALLRGFLWCYVAVSPFLSSSVHKVDIVCQYRKLNMFHTSLICPDGWL